MSHLLNGSVNLLSIADPPSTPSKEGRRYQEKQFTSKAVENKFPNKRDQQKYHHNGDEPARQTHIWLDLRSRFGAVSLLMASLPPPVPIFLSKNVAAVRLKNGWL